MCYKVARWELELCLPFLKIQVPLTKHGSWALKTNLVKCYLHDFRFRFFSTLQRWEGIISHKLHFLSVYHWGRRSKGKTLQHASREKGDVLYNRATTKNNRKQSSNLNSISAYYLSLSKFLSLTVPISYISWRDL